MQRWLKNRKFCLYWKCVVRPIEWKEILFGIQICYLKRFSNNALRSGCRIGWKTVNYGFFFQKAPQERFLWSWIQVQKVHPGYKQAQNPKCYEKPPGGSLNGWWPRNGQNYCNSIKWTNCSFLNGRRSVTWPYLVRLHKGY